MTAFILQSALYLLLAYFAGCFLGCLARRSAFARQPAMAPRPAVVTTAARPMPPPAVSAAPEMSRFERALTTAGAQPAPAPIAQPVQTPPAATPVAAPAPALVVPPTRPVIPAPAAPQAAPSPVAVPVTVPPAQPKAPEQVPAAAAAAAAAAVAAIAAKAAQSVQAIAPANTVLPSAMGSSGPATVTASVTPAVRPAPQPASEASPAPTAPVASPAPVQAQDFTRIRAIDAAMQTALNGLGARTYADIANWKPDDVARVSSALKIPGRIEQENWIEQAQILAKGGETYYSRRKGQGAELARPTPDEGQKLTIRVPAATRPAEAAPAIEPAPTNDALKSAASAAAAAVQAAQAAVKPPAPAAIAAATVPAPAEPTAAPVATAAPAAETPVGLQRDPLQRIAGINAEVERLLNVQGVTRFAQIAAWSPSDISRFDRLLGFEGRIARENWIEQASILSKGGETAYARDLARRATEGVRPAKLADAIQGAASQATAAAAAPAVVAAAAAVAAPAVTPSPAEPVRSELSALRSVRSEAYRGPDSASSQHGREPDDLKRIRGVGVLIEKKLNGLGVTRYEQVANWTVADIERFSDKLDFKGRIERENWVEQARILSAGGQTEFSQRVDRGEVETSTRRPD